MTTQPSAHLLAEDFRYIENDPALQAMLTEFRRLDARDRDKTRALLEAMNRSRLQAVQPPPPDAHYRAPEADGQPAVDLYAYRPPQAKAQGNPAIYFLHGGGYMLGHARQRNAALTELAAHTGAVIFSVEYRTAGQVAFPADLHDAQHGLRYLVQNAAELSIDGKRIVLMGESAGAGLAARLALKNRDSDGFPLKGQILNSPMLDWRTGSPQSPYRNPYAGEFMWTGDINQTGWQMLKGGQTLDEAEMGYYSPAAARDLRGLPPALIAVGSLDLFVDECIDYAQRLIQAGVPTDLCVLAGVPHGLGELCPDAPESLAYRDNLLRVLRRMFAA